MKRLLIIIAILAITACASKNAPVDLSTPDIKQQEDFYIVIGELIINPIAAEIYQETGCVIVVPFQDITQGVRILGDQGFICHTFGHNFKNGECCVCGEVE